RLSCKLPQQGKWFQSSLCGGAAPNLATVNQFTVAPGPKLPLITWFGAAVQFTRRGHWRAASD
ncbi:hypothetical protein, partial [Yoonia maritima]|uniref:hypothetical protein n=1 Tax=Yoonia maritima TaxID=1435347 RepID=UPI0037368D0E